MTQEEKQLLLQDLCARLPYRVMIKSVGENKIIGLYDLKDVDNLPLPYLRPMSSMTEEEIDEWTDLFNSEIDKLMSIEDEKQAEDLASNYFAASHSASVDWLNKKMFDYRGLIPMGLALESPKDMYSYLIDYDVPCEGCKKALNYIKSLPKIKGWVARDNAEHYGNSKGWLRLHFRRPEREIHQWVSKDEFNVDDSQILNDDMFEKLTWEDEPIEVEILIRKV